MRRSRVSARLMADDVQSPPGFSATCSIVRPVHVAIGSGSATRGERSRLRGETPRRSCASGGLIRRSMAAGGLPGGAGFDDAEFELDLRVIEAAYPIAKLL
jgi:hypothetical protein